MIRYLTAALRLLLLWIEDAMSIYRGILGIEGPGE